MIGEWLCGTIAPIAHHTSALISIRYRDNDSPPYVPTRDSVHIASSKHIKTICTVQLFLQPPQLRAWLENDTTVKPSNLATAREPRA